MEYQDKKTEAMLRNSCAVSDLLRGQKYTGKKPEFYKAFQDFLNVAAKKKRNVKMKVKPGEIVFELG